MLDIYQSRPGGRETPQADQIMEMRGGDGVQKSIEAVGYQAHAPSGDELPMTTLEGCVKVTNAAGRIGCVGLYVVGDPSSPVDQGDQGVYSFSMGSFWMKGLSLGTGQANVKQYNRHLRDLIVAGRAIPSQIISHEVPLSGAPGAYDNFDKRTEKATPKS